MLIIIPIAMLVVASLVVGITVLSTDSLQVRGQVNATFDSQDALNTIENSVYRAAPLPTANKAFPASITPPSGQGKNSSTTIPSDSTTFTATGTNPGVLIIRVPAIDKSPLTPGRTVLYAATASNPCGSSTVSSNDIYPVTLVYFVSGGTLYERTITAPAEAGYPAYNAICSSTSPGALAGWYRASCPEGVTTAGCATTDSPLVSNVSSFSFTYIDKTGATTTQATATGVSVTLTTTQRVAGADLPLTLTLNAQSSNF